MRQPRVLWSVFGAVIVALGVWIGMHTYWADVTIPMPLKGDARTNPFYAAERLASELGARPERDSTFVAPPADGVLVLSGWHWSLVRDRRQAIERWVESGGRLVVDDRLVTTNQDFEQWAGIDRAPGKDSVPGSGRMFRERCRTFNEQKAVPSSSRDTRTKLSVCGAQNLWALSTDKPIEWAISDESGTQAIRVRVGRGSVTWINASPFRFLEMLEGDHAWLFVAAADLRRGDSVHFLSEENMPQLLILAWRWGAPVVVVALLIVALLIWRSAVRLGPLVAPVRAERRSLAEQIRGTGYFAVRHGGGDALHAAAVRALEEAARRRVPSYNVLSTAERGAVLERLSGIGATELLSAAYHPQSQRSNQLRTAIGLIESARRHILVKLRRSPYGTH
jgi:hypothetical protein